MTPSKKSLQSFAREYFNARRTPLGISRAAKQKAKAITTIVVDTDCLTAGTVRFSRTVPAAGSSDSELREAAARALAGHSTTESRLVREALNIPPGAAKPIAAPNDIALGSVWHHGEYYETLWIGSIASITHYADLTENEREKLHLLSRKIATDGLVAYAVSSSITATPPRRYKEMSARYLGVILLQPVLFGSIEQAVADIRAHDITIIYASQNPEHVVQSFARRSCIASGPAIVHTYRRGHALPPNEPLYAHLPATVRDQLISRYGAQGIVVRGSLVDFWHQLKSLRS